jgi:nicotinate-nucleotide pyrophosphorylase (carboxylating)
MVMFTKDFLMIPLQTQDIMQTIVTALREDRARDDITSESCLDEDTIVTGDILLKQDAVIAGLCFLPWVFEAVDPEIHLELLVSEGSKLSCGTILAKLKGPAQSILAAERTALNILQHTSGIATQTADFVNEIKGSTCEILDTRKTLPGLRSLQKYAVKIGGGKNHRLNLQDAILIKNNHIKVLGKTHPNPVNEAVERARKAHPDAKIEIEVEDIDMFKAALDSEADIIMLDNMSVEMMKECAKINNQKCYLEASGGVTKEKLKEICSSGINGVSIGALTHSAKAVDISLRINV